MKTKMIKANIFAILLLAAAMFMLFSCKVVEPTQSKYCIKWLESDTVSYTNVLPKLDKYPEDAEVYEMSKSKYVLILRIYE